SATTGVTSMPELASASRRLGNRYRDQKLARCRQLLGRSPSETAAAQPSPDYRDRYQQLTGSSLWECPICHQGRMLVVEILAGVGRRPATVDTS
ncbi:MAG: hypothetical protein AAB225_29860, partial [Acidobacteriota bacterium]